MLEHLRLHDYLAEGDAFHLARARITPKDPVARHGHADFAELFWVTAGVRLITTGTSARLGCRSW